ncbi:hypothetical protein AMST5_04318 [freshwater sediment metagenome]|jgi:ribosomal protein S18 acetylase RimI-like enzyme|uniref:N-acetyltransferase domain-containing protein n=1 Tax=freshwater sediment metagenome TaxID=556182 RepID=A0AA48M668_9ZZZZ
MRGAASWRRLRSSDLGHVARIAAQIHPDFPERPEVFAQKAALFPAGCFVLEKQGAVCGYAIGHPWLLDDIPPLDSFLHAVPERPDCFHVHDVAILETARGNSAATEVERLLTDAARQRGLSVMALVSVYGSDRLWRRLGYRPRERGRPSEKLKLYGEGALYLVKGLPPATV